MSTNLDKSESKFLERVRIALTNAETHEEIKPALADYGMDSQKIEEGKSVYENTKSVWELKKKEDTESRVASNTYKTNYEDLNGLFKRHRDQTLIFFKKQPDLLVTLGVKGNFPSTYNAFFDKVKQYYSAIKDDPAVQAELNKIKITDAVATSCLEKLDSLMADRANYDKELGESQDATKSKDAAMQELKDWMDDFDATARVALYDKPQLLEVLGIFVRS